MLPAQNRSSGHMDTTSSNKDTRLDLERGAFEGWSAQHQDAKTGSRADIGGKLGGRRKEDVLENVGPHTEEKATHDNEAAGEEDVIRDNTVTGEADESRDNLAAEKRSRGEAEGALGSRGHQSHHNKQYAQA
ncbi:hypothetical protein NDU88_006034 [Pleurodeles waltl]|uniref:Uncharacterized protein n=1 Tax=Pleurodeles waltl TaxID=8319 RepID=A0AAV7MCR3_PLEWA|nr:hypothetical protein NDU88_006034 [Pleurodeles waltl]